jgi:hypothetical protein
VAFEGKQSLFQLGKVGKVSGSEGLALNDRQVDLNLVEPGRVDGLSVAKRACRYHPRSLNPCSWTELRAKARRGVLTWFGLACVRECPLD